MYVSFEPDTASILLKEATAKKKEGDLESAIKLLREAYKEISKGSTIYSIDIFLRLPIYLQQAKRNDEAWKEFNILLTKDESHQELIPMDHSAIYDKMRLFLQQEGKNELAVRFGIFSYLSWAIGLYRQKRNNELNEYKSRESIENNLLCLLKKAKKLDLKDILIEEIQAQIECLPNIKFGELANKIDNIID